MRAPDAEFQESAAAPSQTLIDELADWLMEQALRDSDLTEIVSGCCERLQSAGVGLQRCFLGFSTLHPLYRAVGFTWRRGRGLSVQTFPHLVPGLPDNFEESPFHYMLEHSVPCLRRRLDATSAGEFPIFAELHAEGATDYLAFAVNFHHDDDREGMLGSWTSDRPHGFSEGELRALLRIRDRLGVACKMAIRGKLAHNILTTYLGADAGGRVLSGQIKRGDGETIQAAIWYADLRGSTRMADTMSRQGFIDTLNSYFETIGRAVTDQGGEILSFVGDAMLAIFPAVNGESMAGPCEQAFTAALDARARLEAANAGRADDALPPLDCVIGLHVGDVMFGNVGAEDRLTFSVFGAAVNEVVRVEHLCKSLNEPVLASREFTACLDTEWRALGEHDLAGFTRPVAVCAPAAVAA